MLNVTIACVGRLKESYWREACGEYGKRLGGFCRLTIAEVEEERLPDNPSAAQIEACLRAEGRRLLAKVPPGAALWALCIEGKTISSPELARRLEELAVQLICCGIIWYATVSPVMKTASHSHPCAVSPGAV